MIAVLAMSALALVSCKKDKINENDNAANGEKVTFHATVAETVCTDEGEKTTLFGTHFIFEVDDEFGVYSTNMGKCTDGGFKCYISKITDTNGGFEFDLRGDWTYEEDPSIAAYPYRWKTSGSYKAWFNTTGNNVTVQYGFPPTQDYKEGNVASDTYPMIGWYTAYDEPIGNKYGNFDFYPFMSLLKVKIKGYNNNDKSKNVGSIVLEDKECDLAGRTAPMIVTEDNLSYFGTEGLSFVGQSFKTITLNCKTPENNNKGVDLAPVGTDFYFVVPANTLKHFTVTVKDVNGHDLYTQNGAIANGSKTRKIHTLTFPEPLYWDFGELLYLYASEKSSVKVTIPQGLNVNLQMCKISPTGVATNWTNVGETMNLEPGDMVYFKGNNSSFSILDNYVHFEITGNVTASGNIMSLMDETCTKTTLSDYCFNHLFANCTGLTSIVGLSLPSNTLTRACYQSMFEGCVGLTEIPNNFLQAENLAPSCYTSMFKGCTGLGLVNMHLTENAAAYCYQSMFEGCSSLYYFEGSISIENPEALKCCQYMFKDCTALSGIELVTINAAAPDYCCDGMFSGCKELLNDENSNIILNASSVGSFGYQRMFENCNKLVNAPNLPAEELGRYCYYRMFSNCKNIERIEMSAKDVEADRCCESMFQGCTKLNSVTVNFEEWKEIGGKLTTLNWFNNVPKGGTFYCPEGLEAISNISHIPSDWTVVRSN